MALITDSVSHTIVCYYGLCRLVRDRIIMKTCHCDGLYYIIIQTAHPGHIGTCGEYKQGGGGGGGAHRASTRVHTGESIQ